MNDNVLSKVCKEYNLNVAEFLVFLRTERRKTGKRYIRAERLKQLAGEMQQMQTMKTIGPYLPSFEI